MLTMRKLMMERSLTTKNWVLRGGSRRRDVRRLRRRLQRVHRRDLWPTDMKLRNFQRKPPRKPTKLSKNTKKWIKIIKHSVYFYFNDCFDLKLINIYFCLFLFVFYWFLLIFKRFLLLLQTFCCTLLLFVIVNSTLLHLSLAVMARRESIYTFICASLPSGVISFEIAMLRQIANFHFELNAAHDCERFLCDLQERPTLL